MVDAGAFETASEDVWGVKTVILVRGSNDAGAWVVLGFDRGLVRVRHRRSTDASTCVLVVCDWLVEGGGRVRGRLTV